MESVRLCPAPNVAPLPKPRFFDERYELPKHRIKLLEATNPHERDNDIYFFEEPHIYTIFGKPTQLSVSGIAHDYQSHFEPRLAIQMMKKSRKQSWPRLDYVKTAEKITNIDDFTGNCLIYDTVTDETVASLVTQGDDGESGIVVYEILNALRVKEPENEEAWYTFDRALTDVEIIEKWEKNGEDARNRGTEAHLQMELWLNSEPVRLDDGEVIVGLNFIQKCLAPIGAKAYRTEWTIYGEEENVAGCIDGALIMPDNSLFLVDWKRSEKLETKMFGYRNMRAPLNNLEDCDGCGYALQLSLYQYIIEKYYGMRVSGRALASIHPEKPFTTATPYLEQEVEYLMATCRAKTIAREKLGNDPRGEGFKCSLSGSIVMTAVRDEQGNLYEKKNAMLKGITFLPDDLTTQRVASLLEAFMPNVSVPVDAKKWKTIFTPTDDMLFYSHKTHKTH